MNPAYKFICRSCKFECISSIGGERGPHYSTVVMLCRACKDIDTYKLPTKVGINDLFDKDPVCKHCHSAENLIEWDGLSCPQCQGPMRALGSNIRAYKPPKYY